MRAGLLDAGGLRAPALDESLIGVYLRDLHGVYAPVSDGEVATYIPELARADPNWFGLAVATVDGQVYTAGDVDIPFTIQSVSKPFLYGLALQELGRERVLSHVGVEPTGEAFNSTVLDEANNRPYNPMVNAGAIAVSALVPGADYPAKRKAMQELFSRYAGRPLDIDETVFQSERDTGDRNRMIASAMHELGMIKGDVTEILDLYFSQCSVLVTCRDLARMAAVLANGGAHPPNGPQAGERALAQEYVHDVLTVMNSCGMYDYAGQWSYEVGIPAKSGVSGAIAAIIPGQIGIAAFSPRLDRFGNSVRGVAACRRIAEDFGLHVFRTPPNSIAAIRREVSGDAVHSKRARPPHERAELAARGRSIRGVEAQGALYFGSAERLVRRVTELAGTVDYIILDFRRVFDADDAARSLLLRLADRFRAGPTKLLFAQLGPSLLALQQELIARAGASVAVYADRDQALEWCENEVIARCAKPSASLGVTFQTIDLFRDLARGELKALQKIAEPVQFEPGQVIFREGDAADQFLVVVSGSVSVRLRIADAAGERSVRIATVMPGAAIGEMALFDGGVRSADVVADEHCLCYAFDTAKLNAFGKRRPKIMARILANLGRDLSERLRSANREIRALGE